MTFLLIKEFIYQIFTEAYNHAKGNRITLIAKLHLRNTSISLKYTSRNQQCSAPWYHQLQRESRDYLKDENFLHQTTFLLIICNSIFFCFGVTVAQLSFTSHTIT
jgi:hypothetical protein